MASRLAEFQIDGLFGLYTHRIPLNLIERITIIIGPNGRGKTVCLKFIDALFRKNFSFLSEVLFRQARFIFADGNVLKVDPVGAESSGADVAQAGSISLTLEGVNGHTTTWTAASVDRALMRELRGYIPPQWQRINSDTWVDQTDGEELSLSELVERYPIPKKLVAKLEHDLPDEFEQLLKGIDCYLIETQRLLVIPGVTNEWEDERSRYGSGRARSRGSRLAIQQKADKLKSILKDTLTNYANLSQVLDRSFPLRVFEAQGSAKLSEEELRSRLKELDSRRQALMQAGILDTSYDAVSLRSGSIERGVAMALEIYVGDAVKKLDVFSNLASRLDLLKELIGKRFIDKNLQIDREIGFKIVSKAGQVVPLDKLSSGEQHQLILAFDLLFEVKKDSLILIDEPELSLHVAWQKTFIESLSKIIALNAFDVLLATHSPALVAKNFDLAVELGPVD